MTRTKINLIASILLAFIILFGTNLKIVQANNTDYRLAPGSSVSITSSYSQLTTVYTKGGEYDYVKYNTSGSPTTFSQGKKSSFQVKSGEQIAITNTSSNVITIETKTREVNVISTSQPALLKKLLTPGGSMTITTSHTSSVSFGIGGRHDYVRHDKTGAIDLYRTNQTGQKRTLTIGTKMAVTNVDTKGYEVIAPYKIFSFSARSTPVTFQRTLQKGETLEIKNFLSKGSSISFSHRAYDYVKHDKEGFLSSYAVGGPSSFTVNASEKVIVTNQSTGKLEVKGPYDTFSVNSRTLPAMLRETLQSGKSIRVTNPTSRTTKLSFEGSYHYAEYDPTGEVVDYGKGTTTSTRSIQSGNSIVITQSGVGKTTIIGPNYTFTHETSANPALFIRNLASKASMDVKNIGASTSIRTIGKSDTAGYDSTGEIINYNRQRVSGSISIRKDERLGIMNNGTDSLEVYGPYNMFQVSNRTTPVTFQQAVLPGKSLDFKNKVTKSFRIYLSGQVDFVDYDETGKVEEFERDVKISSRLVSAGHRVILTNTDTTTKIVEGPYDAIQVATHVDPALFIRNLASKASIDVKNIGASTFTSIRTIGKSDTAGYDLTGEIINYNRQRVSGSISIRKDERLGIMNNGTDSLEVYGPYNMFQVSNRTTPVTFHQIVSSGKSLEFKNKVTKGFRIYPPGQVDFVDYDETGKVEEFERDVKISSKLVSTGHRVILTNTDTTTKTVEGPYDAIQVATHADPALFTKSLAPKANIDVKNIGASTSAYVRTIGKSDTAGYDSTGEIISYDRQRESGSISIRKDAYLGIMNNGTDSLEVYGPYEIFQISNRATPVTFKQTVSPGKSLAFKNKVTKGFRIYPPGQVDFVDYDETGKVEEFERDVKISSKLVSTGHRVILTNTDTTTKTVEGPYDAIQVATHADPALFTKSLAPKANIEVKNIGASTSAYVRTIGKSDTAGYDSTGEIISYDRQRESGSINIRKDAHLGIMNNGTDSLEVYGPYDIFQISNRATPVTFKQTVSPGKSLAFKNKVTKGFRIYLPGQVDFVDYDKTGKVEEFERDVKISSRLVSTGHRVILTNTDTTTKTVEGPYDAIQVVTHVDPALFVRNIVSKANIDVKNIGASTLAHIRTIGKSDTAGYDSTGEMISYDRQRESGSISIRKDARLAIMNNGTDSLEVYGPYDIFQISNRATPVTFKQTVSPGKSLAFKNKVTKSFRIYLPGEVDFVDYDETGKVEEFEGDVKISSKLVSIGHRLILTNADAATLTVEGPMDAFTVQSHKDPALFRKSLLPNEKISMINFTNSNQVIKVKGAFVYRIGGGSERVGGIQLTVRPGEVVIIRNPSENNTLLYAPYGSFNFDEVNEEDRKPISGTKAADRISKLDPNDYDPQSFHADPIDTSTGAQIINRTLLTAHGTVSIPLQAQYHSLLTEKGVLGSSWSHNYNIRLEAKEDLVTVFWNDFRSNTFNQDSKGVFTSKDLSTRLDKLEKGSNNTYLLKRNDGTVYRFNASGQLTSLEDQTGFKLTFTYATNGQLSTIVDVLSQAKLQISYNSSGYISKVTDQSGRKVTFTYDGAGQLIEIIDPMERVTYYNYNQDSQIVKAISEEIQLFHNVYDGAGRVIEQQDAKSSTTKFAYDEVAGMLFTTITDRNGNEQKRVHDENYQLIRIEDRLGRATIYTYDDYGNRLSIKNPLNQQATFTYDARNNVKTAMDYSNQSMKMTYDADNNLTKAVGPDGKAITYVYDSSHRLTSVTNPEGETTTYSYDPSGLLKTVTDSLGETTEYRYKNGQLFQIINAEGETLTYGYDEANRMVSVTDIEGNETVLHYNSDDQLISETNPLAQMTSYTYDSQGFLLSETDLRGHATTYAYDGNGNLTELTNALNETTKYTYDREDQPVTIANPLGHQTTLTYDAIGNVVGLKNGTVNKGRYVYDALDRLIETYDANDKKIYSATYDQAGNVVTWSDGLNESFTNVFDELNQIVATTDPLGRTTQYSYDGLNRLVSVIDPLQGQANRSFDARSQMTNLTDPNGHSTVYTYDRVGRLLTEVDAAEGKQTYKYNPIGLLAHEKNSRGDQTTYTYDAAGQMTRFIDPDGTVNYTHDPNGNVTAITDGSGRTLTRQYDKLNRVEQYTDDKGQTIAYSYDAAGRLHQLTYPDGKKVTYTYDADDRMTSVTDWKGRKTTYRYDANGLLTSTTRPNGTVETRTYDAIGQMLKLFDKKATGETLYDYTYEYDAIGNLLTQKGDMMNSVEAESLSSFDLNGPGLSPDTPLGEFNLADDEQPLSPDSDSSSLPKPVEESSTDTKMTYTADNRLATYNGQNVLYDADGNMISGPLNDEMQTYVYDSRNRLTKAGGVQYGYNSENARTSVTVGGETTNYVINPHAALSQVLMETDAGGEVQAYYVYGLGLIGREDASGTYQTYHYDRRGSTVALTDMAGQVTDTYAYGPYGEALAHEGTTEQLFQYNGRDGVMTDANGLYHMRARYYNPELKRFVNRDVVRGTLDAGQTLNRYAYVNGNPISYIDPFGLSRDGDSIWLQGGSFLIDTLPYLGTVKGFQQAFSGVNKMTGTQLSTGERWAEGVGSTMSFIPIPGMKHVGKYGTDGAVNLWKQLDLQFFAGKRKYQVGAYKEIKGIKGLDAHHVGQKVLMKKLVKDYDLNTAPAINVPKVGHTVSGERGIVSRSTKGMDDPRQLLARDINELRRVYDDVPNSALKELIELNKKMYPEMRK